MSLSNSHPEFTAFLNDWIQVQDCYNGERAIKNKTTTYLPATTGMLIDGYGKGTPALDATGTVIINLGQAAYEAYLLRARFPNHVKEAIEIAVGMMHRHPPTIKVPKVMEPMLENLGVFGESANDVLRKINHDQLLIGRVGLLLDFPTSTELGKDLPYIALYHATKIINWDDGRREELTSQTLNLVVLDESEYERQADFSWQRVEKYRVLVLGDVMSNESVAPYKFGVFKGPDLQFSELDLKTPQFRGKTFDKIPFVFCNSIDLVASPVAPPLMDLSNLCLTIYRGEADYRQNLFMQGQDTLVIIGGSTEDDGTAKRVGAGAVLNLGIGGDAKYIGVESDGLSEQREALVQDRMRAGGMGAGVLDTTQRERESGDSLDTRIAARTADLNQIALTGAKALERSLQQAAEWMGEDPSEVSVIPNFEFGDMPISTQSLVELAAAKNAGFPISAKSMHAISVKRRYTTKSFEEETKEIEEEKDTVYDPMVKAKAMADLNPNNTGPGQPKKQKEEPK